MRFQHSSDFNGDGKGDILLYDAASQWSGIGFTDGRNVVDATSLWQGWRFSGVSDQNQDSQMDLILDHPQLGWKAAWQMQGQQITAAWGIQGWQNRGGAAPSTVGLK